jgi:IMP dehydrogenase/GMP reductase
MLKRTAKGARPLIVPLASSGVDLKTAFGGWFGLGVGPGAAATDTAAAQRAFWVAVVTSNEAV